MSFKDETFSERFITMGDIAETKFEVWADGQAVRWGQDKTPFQTVTWPEKYRYAPDYIGTTCFYEVQGCGQDQLFKFKLEKLRALGMWAFEFPVKFWLWDSHREKFTVCDLDFVKGWARTAVLKRFPEGKEYVEIPTSAMPWQSFADTIRE